MLYLIQLKTVPAVILANIHLPLATLVLQLYLSLHVVSMMTLQKLLTERIVVNSSLFHLSLLFKIVAIDYPIRLNIK